MIHRMLLIAGREVREIARQPWLVGAMVLLLALIAGAALWILSITEDLHADAGQEAFVAFITDVAGVKLERPASALAGWTIVTLDYLVFSQLLGMTAVLSGHAGIHDRQCGTLPFLLLAPVGRFELLTAKVLGAMAMPLLVYLVVGGGALLAASTFEVSAEHAALLPGSAGWAISFLLGGPVWATFTGAICVAASSLARDVRTAQQVAWFIVFFATLALGPLLVQLSGSVPIQLVMAGVGAVLTALALGVATALVGRDVSR